MEKIDIETKSLNKHGMTRHEMCWDRLHEWMCQTHRMGLNTVSPPTVLEMMNQIEDRILGPLEEEE